MQTRAMKVPGPITARPYRTGQLITSG
jgi:hypothetical protein